MDRQDLIDYIEGEGCYRDESGDNETGELWINCINGDFCYVPFADDLLVSTACHIFYELKVGPMLEYDSDYHVYSTFREHTERETAKRDE